MRDAPAWPCGAIMQINNARWIHQHRITALEEHADGLLLRAGTATHVVPHDWGLVVSSGERGVVTLTSYVETCISMILDWEAANPAEHPVTSQKGSSSHHAWSTMRTMGSAAIAKLVDDEISAALDLASTAGFVGFSLVPAGTVPEKVEGSAWTCDAIIEANGHRVDVTVSLTLYTELDKCRVERIALLR